SSRRISRRCQPWWRPVTAGRRRAAGMASSRRPARRERSSTSSPKRWPASSLIRPSANGISAPAAWCRRSTRRNNSPPTSRKTARRRKRSSRRRALSRSKSPTGCLLGFDAGRLDDRPPLFGLGLVEGGERFRGLLVPREYLLADVGEPLAYRRVGERLDHRGVDLSHDLLRRVLGNPPE